MEIVFAGEPAVLDASGALFLPRRDLLIVSDLHLEKGSFHAARGHPVPCHDTRDTLSRLAAALAAYRPRSLVCLGDSFHDRRAGERIGAEEAASLGALMASVQDWIWITGNHDPEIPERFGGNVAAHHKAGAIALHHRPEDGEPPLIAGHYHPKHRLSLGAGGVSARCFVVGGQTLLMPAFGAYAGGLGTASAPIAALFANTARRHVMIYADKLWAID
jgi:hypothetical protein